MPEAIHPSLKSDTVGGRRESTPIVKCAAMESSPTVSTGWCGKMLRKVGNVCRAKGTPTAKAKMIASNTVFCTKVNVPDCMRLEVCGAAVCQFWHDAIRKTNALQIGEL